MRALSIFTTCANADEREPAKSNRKKNILCMVVEAGGHKESKNWNGEKYSVYSIAKKRHITIPPALRLLLSIEKSLNNHCCKCRGRLCSLKGWKEGIES
jgi:hypothetical protein